MDITRIRGEKQTSSEKRVNKRNHERDNKKFFEMVKRNQCRNKNVTAEIESATWETMLR